VSIHRRTLSAMTT